MKLSLNKFIIPFFCNKSCMYSEIPTKGDIHKVKFISEFNLIGFPGIMAERLLQRQVSPTNHFLSVVIDGADQNRLERVNCLCELLLNFMCSEEYHQLSLLYTLTYYLQDSTLTLLVLKEFHNIIYSYMKLPST